MKTHKKIAKHLRRRIHPNRWLIWAIVFCIIAGVWLLGTVYIVEEELNLSADFAQLVGHRVYINYSQGYHVRYPASWQLEKDQSGNTIFENPNDVTETITIAPAKPSDEGVIRTALLIHGERDYTRGPVSLKVMKGSSSNGHGDLDIAFVKDASHFFYVSGHSQSFEGFVKGLQPLDSAALNQNDTTPNQD